MKKMPATPEFERKVYLIECMNWHEKRVEELKDLQSHVLGMSHFAFETRIRYHRRQAKWFKKLLQQPARLTPYTQERVNQSWEDFNKRNVIVLPKRAQDIENRISTISLEEMESRFKEDNELIPRAPRLSLFRRVWNFLKGEK